MGNRYQPLSRTWLLSKNAAEASVASPIDIGFGSTIVSMRIRLSGGCFA